MSAVDIALLLEPLAGDQPAWEAMEYDQQYTDLERLAQGQPDRVEIIRDPENPGRDIEKITPGKECDAQAVLEAALALFKRTKDLRVAIYVAYGLIRTKGLPGLASGTELIVGMLNQYWDDMHPPLDADENFDPYMRVSALHKFCEPMMLRAVKEVKFINAGGAYAFTLRDIDVANGEAAPLDGKAAATPELLRAVCADMDQAVLAERLAACHAALDHLTSIVSIFKERTFESPDFEPLRKILKRAVLIYQSAANAGGTTEATDAAPQSGEVMIQIERAATPPGKLSSRSDAKKLLEQVCNYIEQAEPAHPSPLLIRRAIRLLDMSFIEIMRELTPDAVNEIEKLGGIRNE